MINGMGSTNPWYFVVIHRTSPLVNSHITNWKITMLLMGKSTISTGPFPIANCWFTRGYGMDVLDVWDPRNTEIPHPRSSSQVLQGQDPLRSPTDHIAVAHRSSHHRRLWNLVRIGQEGADFDGGHSCGLQKWLVKGGFVPKKLGKWWENDGKMMGKWWEKAGKMMGKWWENDGKMMGKWWEKAGKMMGKWWENDGKKLGKWWENDGKMMGKWWENDGKMMGKSWENDGKMMGKWWEKAGKMMGKWWGNDGEMMGKWCENGRTAGGYGLTGKPAANLPSRPTLPFKPWPCCFWLTFSKRSNHWCATNECGGFLKWGVPKSPWLSILKSWSSMTWMIRVYPHDSGNQFSRRNAKEHPVTAGQLLVYRMPQPKWLELQLPCWAFHKGRLSSDSACRWLLFWIGRLKLYRLSSG